MGLGVFVGVGVGVLLGEDVGVGVKDGSDVIEAKAVGVNSAVASRAIAE